MREKKLSTSAKLFENSYLMEKEDFVLNVPNKLKTYTRNSVVTLHDINSVGFLLDGIGIVTRITVQGDEYPPKFISTAHVIDYIYPEDNVDRYELTLCQDCEIVWFEKKTFYEYINQQTRMHYYRELFFLEVEERRFVDRFNEAVSSRLAIDKVYGVLLWLKEIHHSKTFLIPTTMTKFSSIIGISRDRLSESLVTLENDGKIVQDNIYTITVIDENWEAK